MYDTPVFRDDDWGDLELVRQIVLRRLKEDADWHEFDRTWGDRASRFVQFDPPRLRSRFIVLANEVMWQLIIQGVITVGHGEGNPNLPWFRITDYGQKVLAAERFVPHDPTGYMAELSVIAGPLDMTVASRYAEEALACFAAGCNVASVLLLGVAAESAFNQLCDSIRPTLNDAADKAKLDLTIPVRPRHRWLVERYQNLPAAERRRLSESLDVTLTSLYDLIRKQRNDLGHPQEQPPQLSEPPRDYRRLNCLRGWSHEKIKQVFPGSSGASGSDGVGARTGLRFSVVGDRLDRGQNRLHPRDPSEVGTPDRG